MVSRRTKNAIAVLLIVGQLVIAIVIIILLTRGDDQQHQPTQPAQGPLVLIVGESFCFESEVTNERRAFEVSRIDPPALIGSLPPVVVRDNPSFFDEAYYEVADNLGPFIWLHVVNNSLEVTTASPSTIRRGQCN